mgnify:CR=1 FL=1
MVFQYIHRIRKLSTKYFLTFISNNKDFSQENAPSSLTPNFTISNQSNLATNTEKLFSEIIVEWLSHSHNRTKADCDSEEYLSPTTLENYSRNLWTYVFPYLEEHPEYNSILTFSSNVIDEIFKSIKRLDTKRVLLVSFKLIFDFRHKKKANNQAPLQD